MSETLERIAKWAAALGALATAFAVVVGPVSDYFQTRLTTAKLDLERTKARQEYVIATLKEFSDPEEELALLQFLKIEYSDDSTKEWADLQVIRLNAKIQTEVDEQERKLNAEVEMVLDEKRKLKESTLPASPQPVNTPEEWEQALSPEQVDRFQEQQLRIINNERKLNLAASLASPAMPPDAQLRCDETSLQATIFKPLANNRELSSYQGQERAGIVKACLEARPSSVTKWKATYQGPNERIAKRITCRCPG